MRKFLSVMLSLILLVTMAVPAFATANDVETTDTRTVEEILNEYHEKSFATEMEKETGNPSGNSRQASSGKTLEEETVDELRAAGYEAYNVTSDNYEALEADLNTDFADLGLEPGGSYIIVISGEEAEGTTNPNARTGGEGPDQDFLDPGSGGTEFLYYYEPFDRHFTMRYVWATYGTISATSNVSSTYGTAYANTLVNNNVTGSVTSNSIYTGSKTLGTYRTLWGLNTSATYSSTTLSVTCSVDWTRKYVQVYDQSVSAWETTTYYEYASTKSVFTGRCKSNSTLAYSTISYTGYATIYSPNYGDDEYLKMKAVMFYSAINPTYDRTHEIQVRATDENGNVRVLVTVYESE